MHSNVKAIRALNDELRQNLPGGHAVLTPGVAALGPRTVQDIIKTITVYDDFCNAHDPDQEHDFGAFEVDGHFVLFKIDDVDNSVTSQSTDAANPAVTTRVITIMLADEY